MCEKGRQCEQHTDYQRQPLSATLSDASFNAAISAREKGDEWEPDSQLLITCANDISFSAAITACVKGAQCEQILQHQEQLKSATCNDFSLNAALSACEKRR